MKSSCEPRKRGQKTKKEGMALHNLRLTEDITRSFLDEVLRNEKPKQLHDTSEMTVKHFEAETKGIYGSH